MTDAIPSVVARPRRVLPRRTLVAREVADRYRDDLRNGMPHEDAWKLYGAGLMRVVLPSRIANAKDA